MLLLPDEGPYPVLANFEGIAVLRPERFLQAYLILDRVQVHPTTRGYSPEKFFERQDKLGCWLAPIAELLEIGIDHNEMLGENPRAEEEREQARQRVRQDCGFTDDQIENLYPKRRDPLQSVLY